MGTANVKKRKNMATIRNITGTINTTKNIRNTEIGSINNPENTEIGSINNPENTEINTEKIETRITGTSTTSPPNTEMKRDPQEDVATVLDAVKQKTVAIVNIART